MSIDVPLNDRIVLRQSMPGRDCPAIGYHPSDNRAQISWRADEGSGRVKSSQTQPKCEWQAYDVNAEEALNCQWTRKADSVMRTSTCSNCTSSSALKRAMNRALPPRRKSRAVNTIT